MCRCLNVSTSGYYAWAGRNPSQRTRHNEWLLERIKAHHASSDGVLGAPRMHETLRHEGVAVGRHRVARLMRQATLCGVPQRRRCGKKPIGRRPVNVSNHLSRNFAARAGNQKWVADITYIRTAEAWLYLCVVIDLFHHEVVGWSMSRTQDRSMVINAVLMALWQRKGDDPIVLHSDRGTQFTSDDYQQFLADHNVLCSMSAVGHCADNAAAEGFFGMLKRERVNRRRYATIAEARQDVFDYIERFHNPRVRRRIQANDNTLPLIQPSAKTG